MTGRSSIYTLWSIFATVLMLASCSDSFETYNIQGSSMVSLDHDNKLALKVFKNNTLADLDSCEVVHGNFSFVGRIDTTQLGFLMTNDMLSPVPLIIETGGMITVSLERGMSRVSGTPLNDKLYKYLEHYNQLRNYAMALKSRTVEMNRLQNEMDSLETHFIIENSDNMAGLCAFLQMVSEMTERQMLFVPQLQLIMEQSSESFRRNPYVNNFYKVAREYMNQNNEADLPAMAKPVIKGAEEER